MNKTICALVTTLGLFFSNPTFVEPSLPDPGIPLNPSGKELREKNFHCKKALLKNEKKSNMVFYCTTKNNKGNFLVIYAIKKIIELEREHLGNGLDYVKSEYIFDLEKCYVAEDKNKDGDARDEGEQGVYQGKICKKKFEEIKKYLSH